MKTPTIRDFTIHGSSGHSVLNSKWLDWIAEHQNKPGCTYDNRYGFGRGTHFSWYVGDERIERAVDKWIYVHELPDASGFIGFEKDWKPDNCLLFDAYGKERMRLTVPWELTGRQIPKDAVMTFKNVSAPCINPQDGKVGQFGVSAYIEGSGSGGYAEGDWYFELDYHTGKFLWGKEIRS